VLRLSPNYLVALGFGILPDPSRGFHIAHRSRIKSRSCEIHVAIDYSERTSADHLQHTIFAGLNDQ
jgi:hypothetical protein